MKNMKLITEAWKRFINETDNYYESGDYAWESFSSALNDAKQSEPSQGMLGKLVYDHFDQLVDAMGEQHPDLKVIRKSLSDVLNNNPSIEEQMEIINSLEDRVREAIGLE